MLSTNPTSGTKVNQGRAVALTVSSGPANVIVPSLVGLSQLAAGQTLAARASRWATSARQRLPVPARRGGGLEPRDRGQRAAGQLGRHRRVRRAAAATTTTDRPPRPRPPLDLDLDHDLDHRADGTPARAATPDGSPRRASRRQRFSVRPAARKLASRDGPSG